MPISVEEHICGSVLFQGSTSTCRGITKTNNVKRSLNVLAMKWLWVFLLLALVPLLVLGQYYQDNYDDGSDDGDNDLDNYEEDEGVRIQLVLAASGWV